MLFCAAAEYMLITMIYIYKCLLGIVMQFEHWLSQRSNSVEVRAM